MKSKFALLVFSVALLAVPTGCEKDETTSEDAGLAGVQVTVGEKGRYDKLFVLNEGKMGTNNATVDFFRFSDGYYVRNAFSQMNPTLTGGLGDVGNDIVIDDDEVWAAINGSGLIEVFDAEDERHIATIDLPGVRFMAIDDDMDYAYATTYSGAYYGGPDRLGAVYRIDTETYKVKDSVTVGYQPEGVAIYGDRIYVACSGGYKSDYSYDNRVFVISRTSFTVLSEIEVATNLKNVFIDRSGNGWVTALGDYGSTHSGLYCFTGATGSISRTEDVYVSCATICGDVIYAIGTPDEWDWSADAVKQYMLYKVSTTTGGVTSQAISLSGAALGASQAVPFSICVNSATGDIYIGDAGDYVNPGTVSCYDSSLSLKWTATAGVDPGHLALWED